jgi:hypothetical protein
MEDVMTDVQNSTIDLPHMDHLLMLHRQAVERKDVETQRQIDAAVQQIALSESAGTMARVIATYQTEVLKNVR